MRNEKGVAHWNMIFRVISKKKTADAAKLI